VIQPPCGVVKGTRRVRKGVPTKRRDVVRRLGKTAGAMVDAIEAPWTTYGNCSAC